MFSFRFAVVPFVLAMSAATSAIAGAGTLTATVTPVSQEVTYSADGPPPLVMYVGYQMSFTNTGGNTINNVKVTFTPNNAGMTLFTPTTNPLPAGCAPVQGSNSFQCTVTQMKAGVSFPASGKFLFFYTSPKDPTPGDQTDNTYVDPTVSATYAESTNGSNPPPNSDVPNILDAIAQAAARVTLGTVNNNNIKSAIPKNGGTLRTGNAAVPTDSNKATEELVIPTLFGTTTYTTAVVVVDVSDNDSVPGECLTNGHFRQCPLYTTSVPDPTTGSPLRFSASTPLTLIYRVHPSNLKMSASQILTGVQLLYKPDGGTSFTRVNDFVCPSEFTANNTGFPCVAKAPQCFKKSTAPTPALEGVCEWKLNNIENGLLKLQ